ncbi:MAG: TraR/DksA family transcriptional regulator [Fidelibacterota bacterium]
MANNKKKYNDEDLKYFKNLIEKMRKETILEIRRLENNITGKNDNGEEMESSYSFHMADAGTDSMEREKDFLWLSRAKKYLGHLNNALDRVSRNVYGVCIDCGELIPKERLEEVPHTQHCARCKNKPK